MQKGSCEVVVCLDVCRLQELKEKIDQVKVQIETAEREFDLGRAAQLKYGKSATRLGRPGGGKGC